jgi:murein hydrolase activator
MRAPIAQHRSQPRQPSSWRQYVQGKRLATVLFVAAHLGLLSWTIIALAAPADLDQRLKDERQELKQLRGQIKDYKDRLERTKRRERTVTQELEESDHLLQQKGRELQTHEGHLKTQAEKHAALVKDMQERTRQLQARQGFLQQRLRALYKQGRVAYLPFLLSASDASDFLTRVRFTMKLVEYDADLVQQYRVDLEALERTRRAVKAREEQLTSTRLRVAAKKEEIEMERLKKNQLLAKIRDQQGTYASAMQELEQASARLMALITQLEQQRKRALAQQAREQRQRQARLSRPETPPPSADHHADAIDDQSRFGRLRGQLSWPLTGKLVSTYGKVKHPSFDIYTFNKGIGISATPGTAFRVIEAGQVLYADWFKGYGNLLIVDHGDSYYSVYAYASELLVQVGERVKRYQVVGKTGEGGSLNGPALYFEIRHHGKPQNPLEWLADHQP